MKTIYLDDQNQVTLTCPQCGKIKTVDATPYLKNEGPIKILFRFRCPACKCGHSSCSECIEAGCETANTNVFQLERRKFFRRKVDFTGSLEDNRKKYPVRVLDLSRTGVMLRILTNCPLKSGSKARVSFNLDDTRGTLIEKDLIIRSREDELLKAEFATAETYDKFDKSIGFYLMQKADIKVTEHQN